MDIPGQSHCYYIARELRVEYTINFIDTRNTSLRFTETLSHIKFVNILNFDLRPKALPSLWCWIKYLLDTPFINEITTKKHIIYFFFSLLIISSRSCHYAVKCRMTSFWKGCASNKVELASVRPMSGPCQCANMCYYSNPFIVCKGGKSEEVFSAGFSNQRLCRLCRGFKAYRVPWHIRHYINMPG